MNQLQFEDFVEGLEVGSRVLPPEELQARSILFEKNKFDEFSWEVDSGYSKSYPMKNKTERKWYKTLKNCKKAFFNKFKKYFNERRLVLNRIKTPDGTILTSYHQHDYQSHIDRVVGEMAIDGGLSYLGRMGEEYTELSVWDDAPFEIVRESFHWGVLVEGRKHEFRLLKDLKTDHIQNILSGDHGSVWAQELMKKELQWRRLKH